MSDWSSTTVPAAGSSSPVIALKVVVLPAPFGPMSPVMQSASTSRSTSLTALSPPKRTVRPRTSSSATTVLRGDAQSSIERDELAHRDGTAQADQLGDDARGAGA